MRTVCTRTMLAVGGYGVDVLVLVMVVIVIFEVYVSVLLVELCRGVKR